MYLPEYALRFVRRNIVGLDRDRDVMVRVASQKHDEADLMKVLHICDRIYLELVMLTSKDRALVILVTMLQAKGLFQLEAELRGMGAGWSAGLAHGLPTCWAWSIDSSGTWRLR